MIFGGSLIVLLGSVAARDDDPAPGKVARGEALEGSVDWESTEAPTDYPPVPAAPSRLRAAHIEVDSAAAVRLAWESRDPLAFRWGVTLNGVPIGMVTGAERSVVIHDVVTDEDIEYGVLGFTEDGYLGERATLILPAKTT